MLCTETLPLQGKPREEVRQASWHAIVNHEGYDGVPEIKGSSEHGVSYHVHCLLAKEIERLINIFVVSKADYFLHIVVSKFVLEVFH